MKVIQRRMEQQKKLAEALEAGAVKRREIAAENLMVIGGRKYDLSKDYSIGLPIGVDPESIIPRFVTANGKVFDTDKPEDGPYEDLQVHNSDTFTIDGRALNVGAFGDKFTMVVELYEQWMVAVQVGYKTVFRTFDREWSADIMEQCKSARAKRFLEEQIEPATLQKTWTIDWGNPHIQFEDWMEWCAATMRWRIKTDLPHRYEHELDIRTRDTLKGSQNILEITLIAVEKFLAMPEKSLTKGGRLTAV